MSKGLVEEVGSNSARTKWLDLDCRAVGWRRWGMRVRIWDGLHMFICFEISPDS